MIWPPGLPIPNTVYALMYMYIYVYIPDTMQYVYIYTREVQREEEKFIISEKAESLKNGKVSF